MSAKRNVRPFFSVAAIFLAAQILGGCYIVKQGGILLSYQKDAVPIDALSENADTPEDTRHFIARVRAIKKYSIQKLGLTDDKNYTRYLELDRDYLAAVVSAAQRDSFTRYEWRFPLVGKMPYKGFFVAEDAKEEAKKLKGKDLDVWIRKVDAFSTLGYFRDPLYSYMKKYSESRLADLIIHEQTHAAVFLKNHVQFNEGLATFIGKEGARLYILDTYGKASDEYRQMEEGEEDAKTFIRHLKELIAELEVLYGGPLSREEILMRKQEIISNFQEKFEIDYPRLFKSESYRGFSRLPVNNAYLSIYQLYTEGDSWFEDLYHRAGADLSRFIAAARTLEGKKGDPRLLLEEALGLTAGES